jgi:hypothetical protein
VAGGDLAEVEPADGQYVKRPVDVCFNELDLSAGALCELARLLEGDEQ